MPDEAESASPQGKGESRRGALPPPSVAVFVQSFAAQCLVALGQARHPASGEAEVDLEQAKFAIDLLEIVQNKTKGNLDKDEKRLLDGILYDLRMRYVAACRGGS